MMSRSQEKITAFIFGTVFVITILVVALLVPDPTTFQVFVFRVILSLAAGGVAAMIPGFINVEISSFLRAGGALAVFAILYFLNPTELVASTDPGPLPKGSARETSDKYLQIADKVDEVIIWGEFSNAAKKLYEKDDVIDAFRTVRKPLGDVKERNFVGSQSSNHLAGWPNAHYRTFQYNTLFQNGQNKYEIVMVMSEDEIWKVAGHTINPILN
ncbi:MAG: DUF4019 domain-containing protein [Methylotenera sp.]